MPQNVSAVEQAFEKASASLAEQAPATTTTDSGQAAAVPAAAPTETISDAAQAQETTVAPAKTPEGVPDGWVWNGDVNSLPEILKEYGKGVQRVYTKSRQELADTKKELETFRSQMGSDEFKQFQAYKLQQQQLAHQPAQDWLTEQEWQEAQIDPRRWQSIIDRRVQQKMQELEQAYAPLIQEVQQKQSVAEAERTINDFAEVHPDFWTLYDAGILKPIIRDVVELGGGTLDQAYAKAKEIQSYFDQQSTMKSQARVQEKKSAVSLSPSSVSEPEIVYAKDKDDAFRQAFENAWNQKRVKAVVRPQR